MAHKPDTHPGNCMTVATLIDLLKEHPGDTPITGYRSDEATGFVSEDSVTLEQANDRPGNDLYNADGTRYVGLHLNIMGD